MSDLFYWIIIFETDGKCQEREQGISKMGEGFCCWGHFYSCGMLHGQSALNIYPGKKYVVQSPLTAFKKASTSLSQLIDFLSGH